MYYNVTLYYSPDFEFVINQIPIEESKGRTADIYRVYEKDKCGYSVIRETKEEAIKDLQDFLKEEITTHLKEIKTLEKQLSIISNTK